MVIFLNSCSLDREDPSCLGLRVIRFEGPLRKEMNTNVGIGPQEESLQGRGAVGRVSQLHGTWTSIQLVLGEASLMQAHLRCLFAFVVCVCVCVF